MVTLMKTWLMLADDADVECLCDSCGMVAAMMRLVLVASDYRSYAASDSRVVSFVR